MRRRREEPQPRSDGGAIFVSLVMAGAAAGFAGYTLYSGPLRPGSDFQLIDLAAIRQNLGSGPGFDPDAADSLVTGSISPAGVITSPRDVPAWFSQPGRPIDYRLRSAGERRALVDVSSGADSFIYGVETGGLLPGLGRVRAIRRQGGSWQVLTERTRISANGVELAGE